MTKPIKSTASTVTRGEKYGFLTVIRPRIKVQSCVAYHECKCACGYPRILLIADHKLRGGDRVSCLQCPLTKHPIQFCVRADILTERSLTNFIARNGPTHIEDKQGKLLWVRPEHKFPPFPYHVCRDDLVLVARTFLFGIVTKVRQDTYYEVKLDSQFHYENMIKQYRAEQLLLLYRPGFNNKGPRYEL